MLNVDIKELLEAGIHFGHQRQKWNPKMAGYIYTVRNDIHIIDLEKALKCLNDAYDFVKNLSSTNGNIIFVGTKRQAQDVIKEEAERCEAFYVNNRWLGGTLTNFSTIRKSLWKLIDFEEKQKNGEFDGLQKKERARLLKEYGKLVRNLGGMKGLEELPSAIYIIDSAKEKICVEEARKMGIPTIAIVDTNGDPDKVTYPIPANDDAIRSIRFITSCIANAVIEGRNIKEGLPQEEKVEDIVKDIEEKEIKTEEVKEKEEVVSEIGSESD
ncbi:MAG: 30S ribosomal protein S2 [bacterium]